MSNLLCSTHIIDIGRSAKDFYEENMLITFQEGISGELVDYCYILPKDFSLNNELSIGQKITIGQYCYHITAIGSTATENFKALGHLTIIFDGAKQAKLDGTIHVLGDYPVTLNIGDKLIIEK